MGATLLDLVQTAQTELGLQAAQYVIRATNNTDRQFGALASRIGTMMMRAHDWTVLSREFIATIAAPVSIAATVTAGSPNLGSINSFGLILLTPYRMIISGPGIQPSTRLLTIDFPGGRVLMDQPATVSGTAVTLKFQLDDYPAPADFSRAINRTHWDRKSHWELRGPTSPQEDAWTRSGTIATGPRIRYRMSGSMMRLWPANAPGTTIYSEYISKNWVVSAAGVTQPRFLADADTCVFDDDLMVMGLKWLFFAGKGFAADDLKADFERAVTTAMAMDGGAPTLSMTRSGGPILLSSANIPDGNWNVP